MQCGSFGFASFGRFAEDDGSFVVRSKGKNGFSFDFAQDDGFFSNYWGW